jgi:hypothetical protein
MHAEIVAKLAGRKKTFREDVDRATQTDKLNEDFAQHAKALTRLVADAFSALTKCGV